MNKISFNDLYEEIINQIEESIFLFDPNGNLVFLNKAAEEFLGTSAKQFKQKHFSALFKNIDEIITLIDKTLKEERLLNSKDISISEYENKKIDIYLYPFYSSNYPHLNKGVILCIKEKFSFIEKINYNQSESLLMMLMSIAHEIKNPLSGIKGSAQLLREKAENEAKQYIDVIIKETDRLNRILNDYLFIGRKPKFKEINIHEILEHTLKVMAPLLVNSKVSIYKEYDPSLPSIKGDASMLLQVFINLIKNSVESMERIKNKRRISISTKLANEYVVFRRSNSSDHKEYTPKKQRWLKIELRDSGLGIKEEELEKIFLPFFSKKKGGTGIGLALSQKIIRDHGGFILAKTDKSKKGAVFEIYLPF
ncbi:MAG: ATP-binding protein [Thermodesulfovibrionales bacterium]|nr:ATP-binding protein [Thermodesulfovibrionales bacterium]